MLGLDIDGSTKSQIADGFGDTLDIQETPGILDCSYFRSVLYWEVNLRLFILCQDFRVSMKIRGNFYAFVKKMRIMFTDHSG